MKKLKSLSKTLAILLALLLVFQTMAFAVTEGYVVQDKGGNLTQFNLSDLFASYNAWDANPDSSDAALYLRYYGALSTGGKVVAQIDDKGGYIDMEAITEMYNGLIAAGENEADVITQLIALQEDATTADGVFWSGSNIVVIGPDGEDTADTIDVSEDGKVIDTGVEPEKVVVEVEQAGIAAVSESVGTWVLTISAAFENGESIVINGITYTCKTTPTPGSLVEFDENSYDADEQADALASLLDLAISDDFVITGDTNDDAIGVITFEEKVCGATNGITAYTTAGTGRISALEQTAVSASQSHDIYGSWTLQVTGEFVFGDAITIGGVTYTHGTTSGFSSTTSIDNQVSQLLALLKVHPTLAAVFDFTAAGYMITAKQKVAGVGTMPEVAVMQLPATGVGTGEAATVEILAGTAGTPATWTLEFESAAEGVLFTYADPNGENVIFWLGSDPDAVEYDVEIDMGTEDDDTKVAAAVANRLKTYLTDSDYGYTVSSDLGVVTITESKPLTCVKPAITVSPDNQDHVKYDNGTAPVADIYGSWSTTVEQAFSAGDQIEFCIDESGKGALICGTTPGFIVATAEEQAAQLAGILSADTANFSDYDITVNGAVITFTEKVAGTVSNAVTSNVTKAAGNGDGGTAAVTNKYSTGGIGQSSTGGSSSGAWSFAITTAFKTGDTIEINNAQMTCIAAGKTAGDNEFNEALPAAQAVQIAQKLDADTDAGLNYTYSASGAVITITEKVAGTYESSQTPPAVAITTGTGVVALEQTLQPTEAEDGIAGVWTITFNRLLETGDSIAVTAAIDDTRVYSFGTTFDGETIEEQIANFKALLDAVTEMTTLYTIVLEGTVLTFMQKSPSAAPAPAVVFTPAV